MMRLPSAVQVLHLTRTSSSPSANTSLTLIVFHSLADDASNSWIHAETHKDAVQRRACQDEYSEFKTSEHKPAECVFCLIPFYLFCRFNTCSTEQNRTEQNILALVENKYVTVHPSHIIKFILMCTASGKDGLQLSSFTAVTLTVPSLEEVDT